MNQKCRPNRLVPGLILGLLCPLLSFASGSARANGIRTYTDSQGVVHLTDNPESVPAQYRTPAAAATQGGAS